MIGSINCSGVVFNRDLNRLKKTSIIIPTHNRKEKLINCLKHIQENIIIGHLIPAGTGSQNYQKCFGKNVIQSPEISGKLLAFDNV